MTGARNRVFEEPSLQEFVGSKLSARATFWPMFVKRSLQTASFIADLLFGKGRKITISGAYPPLSFPLEGALSS